MFPFFKYSTEVKLLFNIRITLSLEDIVLSSVAPLSNTERRFSFDANAGKRSRKRFFACPVKITSLLSSRALSYSWYPARLVALASSTFSDILNVAGAIFGSSILAIAGPSTFDSGFITSVSSSVAKGKTKTCSTKIILVFMEMINPYCPFRTT